MIELIMDIVSEFFERTSASLEEGSRSQRRDRTITAAILAVVMIILCVYCLIRGWQTNDSEYLIIGFLALVVTLLEILRLILRHKKN